MWGLGECSGRVVEDEMILNTSHGSILWVGLSLFDDRKPHFHVNGSRTISSSQIASIEVLRVASLWTTSTYE